ncbi:hypothetical protein PAEVO_03760 [Paenibacillus sp. GM2FR]|uniref:portal protein n=1 Tax=Paenibacillus sp. GM2FR TaxID=2059268 RepID=UPI000C276DD8|nr:hypothetical protein [Paenibacillus sp. GM2FR]PJN53655.1 hypothetical protein PAEVO_03760 [Paenibacillus sp. GM2FR]
MSSLLEKFRGVFTESTAKTETVAPNTPEQQHMYDTVMEDYNVYKAARQPIEKYWQEEQRFYMGDHWYGLRSEAASRLRPNAVENITFSQIEAIVGKLTGWMPYPDFAPVEESDKEKARDLNDYMPNELRAIKFKSKHVRAIRRMVIHGPLIYKTVFDPTVEGGRGMNRYKGRNDILPVDLGSFFPDPRIRDFIYLQDMGAIIVKTTCTMEYFNERWPEQGAKVEPDNNPDDDVFANDYGEGDYKRTSDQRQTAGLIEYWYRGLPKTVSQEDNDLFTEMAAEKLAEGIDPAEYIAKAEGRMDGVHCIYVSTSGVFLEHKAYVYDHGKYPFVARTLYPDESSAWGKGFMRDMIKPQIMKNKYAEIAVETMARQGNGGVMYEDGAITKPQTWQERRSQPGAMLPVAQGRLNDVKELQGINVPGSLFNLLQYYDDMLQKIPGQFDSANGAANPNVKSGEQAKALMAAAGTRLNTVSDMIQEALEEVFAQYIELIAQFYTDERIARVTGRAVAMSRDAIMSQAASEFDTGETVLPVKEEYLPEFDITVHIGVDKPQDREYWLQLVFNLINMVDPITKLPMADAEAVAYVIQTGRMEPMDVIRARIEEAAQREQQMQQQMQQAQQAMQENQGLQQQVAELQGAIQEGDHQKQAFDQTIQQQKMNLEAAKVANDLMRSGQR